MRKLFSIVTAAALGVAVSGSQAGANSLAFRATDGSALTNVELQPGGTLQFIVVMTLTTLVSNATAQIDTGNALLGLTVGTNSVLGTGLSEANFALRDLSFNQVGTCGPFDLGTQSRTCTAAGGAPSAGNIGGLTTGLSNTGTFTIGAYTLQDFSPGITGTLAFRFRPGVNDWADAFGNAIALPTTNSVEITVIPEPATAGLIGLGLVGLVLAGRRNRA